MHNKCIFDIRVKRNNNPTIDFSNEFDFHTICSQRNIQIHKYHKYNENNDGMRRHLVATILYENRILVCVLKIMAILGTGVTLRYAKAKMYTKKCVSFQMQIYAFV